MRTRRLPTGGLASLAVVLSALAVVVVAAAPGPRTLVKHEVRVVTVTRTTHRPHRHHATRRRDHHRPTGTLVDVGDRSTRRAPNDEPPTHRAASDSTPSTAPPSTSSTTTTSVPVTTTTRPAPQAAPTSRRGTFAGGRTTATERLGAIRSVTVSFPTGIRVTLSVTCGFATSSTTSFTSATVHVQGGGAACVATFTVPASSPQPAPWRLVAS
ncbi:MAG TPA: hypothetical protein VGZ03_04695 [Acidimicrobiales bacterium]|jgi:hypothetical protein|nr:hypothetical protein [Acidimicrobiales bacterium]